MDPQNDTSGYESDEGSEASFTTAQDTLNEDPSSPPKAFKRILIDQSMKSPPITPQTPIFLNNNSNISIDSNQTIAKPTSSSTPEPLGETETEKDELAEIADMFNEIFKSAQQENNGKKDTTQIVDLFDGPIEVPKESIPSFLKPMILSNKIEESKSTERVKFEKKIETTATLISPLHESGSSDPQPSLLNHGTSLQQNIIPKGSPRPQSDMSSSASQWINFDWNSLESLGNFNRTKKIQPETNKEDTLISSRKLPLQTKLNLNLMQDQSSQSSRTHSITGQEIYSQSMETFFNEDEVLQLNTTNASESDGNVNLSTYCMKVDLIKVEFLSWGQDSSINHEQENQESVNDDMAFLFRWTTNDISLLFNSTTDEVLIPLSEISGFKIVDSRQFSVNLKMNFSRFYYRHPSGFPSNEPIRVLNDPTGGKLNSAYGLLLSPKYYESQTKLSIVEMAIKKLWFEKNDIFNKPIPDADQGEKMYITCVMATEQRPVLFNKEGSFDAFLSTIHHRFKHTLHCIRYKNRRGEIVAVRDDEGWIAAKRQAVSHEEIPRLCVYLGDYQLP